MVNPLSRLIRISTFAKPHIRYYSNVFPETETDKNIRLLNNNITNHIRNNRLNDAKHLFENSKHRNTVTWNSLLSGYVRRKELTNARNMFDKMPQKDVSWNTMISGYVSCGWLNEGRVLFDEMECRDVVTWNTVISGYAKNGRMSEALKLFLDAEVKNVVTWNAVVTGFLSNGDLRSAADFYRRMPERDGASVSVVVSGLIQNGELDEAGEILVEASLEKDERVDLVHAFNTLIAGYGRKGRIEDARRLFDRIPYGNDCGRRGVFRRNVVSWNTMIMCYVKAKDVVSARVLTRLVINLTD